MPWVFVVPNFLVFFMSICSKAKFGRGTQCVNMCYLPSREINRRVLGVQPLPQ
ncbi:hypothetical protein AB205_0187900 [Aquarana catesbeiana]|uniref:Uncharacterized protein n=1 Tax=Aquarana catesbeiana TaxID=8400 RepID=A0A2G9Q1L0_AQUCT|nr:hypothetical protein AB205_0187900 [Aquarana catesbeiana]